MFPRKLRSGKVAGLITCLLLALIGLPPTKAQKRTEKRTKFGTGLQVGFGLTQYHDTCVMFRVFFISGEFFSKLRRSEARNGTEFKKGSETYHTFPDDLVVDVQADAYPCAGSSARPPALDLGAGLLSSTSFELNWKVGPDMRPVSIVSKQVQHRAPGARWDYFLEFPTKDISLTEQLVIDVSIRNTANKTRLLTQVCN
jgi:hypothetical protein